LDVVQDRAVMLGAGLITGVDQTGERITHAREFGEAQLQVGDARAGHRPSLVVLDVVEGEPESLSAFDEAHDPHRIGGVGAIPDRVRSAAGSKPRRS
jgi:hypothetical protein